MTPERWQKIKRLLDAALDLPAEKRDAYLAEACGEDAQLRAEVADLCAAEAEVGDFMDHSALGAPAAPKPLSGSRVGPYRLKREIGRGGMGRVYLAERVDDAYEKTVAVKLLQHGLDSTDFVALFERERQVLAHLEHPNITRLLDGGTADGRPFLVMEYIEGTPIDRYCDERQLDCEERLVLFRTVCEAVHFAHRNLVVHRDLKPANILVTDEGEPKLLDFGIAKMLGPVGPRHPSATIAGSLPLTPACASPEQILGDPITTSTDVYALGVLLYQLLSGRMPYDLRELRASQVERVICEEVPVRPSARVIRSENPPLDGTSEVAGTLAPPSPPEVAGTLPSDTAPTPEVAGTLPSDTAPEVAGTLAEDEKPGAPEVAGTLTEDEKPGVPEVAGTLATISEARRTHPAALRRFLAGDLDAIVMKALRKEPEERYSSAERLLQDLDRFAAHQPIEAHRGRLLYRSRKFIVRHRNRLAGAAALVAILGVAGLAVDREARLRQNRLEAALERDQSVALRDFLVDAFRAADPSRTGRGDLTARQALERAASNMEETLESHPETRATLLDALGRIYRGLAEFDRADEMLQEALRLREESLGSQHLLVADSLNNLAVLYRRMDQPEKAIPLLRQAVEIQRNAEDPKLTHAAAALNNLAATLRTVGQNEEAEEIYLEVLSRKRDALDENDPAVSRTLNNLAALKQEQGHYAEAEDLLRKVLARRRSTFGERHEETANSLNNLGLVLVRMERYGEAEVLLFESLAMRREIFGDDHPKIARVLNNLGLLGLHSGSYAEARNHLEEALRIAQATWGAGGNTAVVQRNLAALQVASGDLANCEESSRAALRGLESSYPADYWRVVDARNVLAGCLAGLGQVQQALDLLERGLASLRVSKGPEHHSTREAQARLERLHAACGGTDALALGSCTEPPLSAEP